MTRFQKPQVWGSVRTYLLQSSLASLTGAVKKDYSLGEQGGGWSFLSASETLLVAAIKHLRSIRQEGVVWFIMVGKSRKSECEVAGYIVSSVRKKRERGMMVLSWLSYLYSVWDPNPWDGAVHTQWYSLIQSAFLLATHLVSMVILNLVKLATKIGYILSPPHLTEVLTSKGTT